MHVELIHVAEYMTVTMKTTQHIGSHSFRLLIHSIYPGMIHDQMLTKLAKLSPLTSPRSHLVVLASSHSCLAVLASIWQHLLLMEASSTVNS